MAQSRYAPLDGTTVSLRDLTGPFRHCECGGARAILHTNGAPGFYLAELKCCDCGAHTSWLGRDHLDAMLAQRGGEASPNMGQIMAECDCPHGQACDNAGRCLAEAF